MSEHEYTYEDLGLLAALRQVEPLDSVLSAPPDSVWSAISAATAGATPLPTAPPSAPRHRSVRWMAAAGAMAAALVVGLLVNVLREGSATSVLARAPLTSEGLDGAPVGLQGDAYVTQRADGRTLHVDLGGLRPTSGEYLELWLIKPDISGMVSLGAARPDGNYELPSGLNVEEYPIVDVSTEPYDGDPVHSGGSLLRGILDA